MSSPGRMICGALTFAVAMNFAPASPSETTSNKRVALVFDDGPKPADAEPLLAILAKEHVRVTFSLVGDRVAENPDVARKISRAGHEIANHSQTHSHAKELKDDALEHEVADAQAKITEAVGRSPKWYWPPFLEIDERVQAAAAKAHLNIYRWHHIVVSKDYDSTVSADEIRRLATTDVRDGSVILFHEWRAETRAQLPAILTELRRQNCLFFTFSELDNSLAKSPAD